ncbi:concanavalin A-like lectin/glucanase domain-containing protein [Crassisporium funariophilum]|nr:concanavalin A-like lectin/glucanase domain-containing protein [Crassisporium funariophilum]
MFPFSKLVALVFVAVLSPIALAAPSPQADAPPAACSIFATAGGAGVFTQQSYTDFSAVKPGGDAAAFLSSAGFGISSYPIIGTPYPREFLPANVLFGEGTLDMKVNAFFGTGSIGSAEFATLEHFQYGSVRTVQKSSSVPGVVEGNFFYASDNQETDIEILTSTIDTDSACVPKGVWVSNQALTPGTPASQETIPFAFDPRADFHEYRIDWLPGSTTFFIDGVQISQKTTNVPTAVGPWIWNAWSNGDPCWSNGPPAADSITQIRSIEIYKGYIGGPESLTEGFCGI